MQNLIQRAIFEGLMYILANCYGLFIPFQQEANMVTNPG